MSKERVQEFINQCLIVDTETTSKDYKEAEIIEFSCIGVADGEVQVLANDMYKPSISILPEISAVTHIVDEMVEDKKLFQDSNDNERHIFELVNQHNMVLVAHNAPYDKGVIANYKNMPNCDASWVCTMRLAKRLFIEDETVKQFNLQYLRYRFKLVIDQHVDPHRALSDCIVTARLLEFLVSELDSRGILDDSMPYRDQIIDWINKPIFVPKMNFGKHKDQKWDDIPTDYIVWAINNLDCLKESNPLYDPDMVHTIAIVMEDRI